MISGTPTTTGTFTGTITAANGTTPDATQAFSIVIGSATLAPAFTSASPPATGFVGVPYTFTATASGTAPITFSATGLPDGLAISPDGAISGIPTTPGSFNGRLTAANGTPPDATQDITVEILLVPLRFSSLSIGATDVLVAGSGPTNGVYTVLVSPDPSSVPQVWTAIATNTLNNAGKFSFTDPIPPGAPPKFYRLRLP
ncbi:MAG: hypothetical protein U1F77_09560 [Kiritimatiellia bacterium]